MPWYLSKPRARSSAALDCSTQRAAYSSPVRPRTIDELLRETESALRAYGDRQAVLTFRKIALAHRDPQRFRPRIVEAERDVELARSSVLRLAHELERMGVADTATRVRQAVEAAASEAAE
jgi:hypothetical protein